MEDLARLSIKNKPVYVGVDDAEQESTVDGLEQVILISSFFFYFPVAFLLKFLSLRFIPFTFALIFLQPVLTLSILVAVMVPIHSSSSAHAVVGV